jgi:hypothetical protein
MPAKPKFKKFSVSFNVTAQLSMDVMAPDIESAIAIGRGTHATDVLSEHDEVVDSFAEVTSVYTYEG